jgi:Repeat of Unknown Function (DUF347)
MRPLGASFADWMGKPQSAGGLGWGDGPVALVLTALIVCLVGYLEITRRDVQRAPGAARGAHDAGSLRFDVSPERFEVSPESVE